MRHFRTDLSMVGAMVLALMPVRAVFGQTPGAPAQLPRVNESSPNDAPR